MKYTSKKGTVINIPDGLNPKQIQQIRNDADNGYGTRAQETANKLGGVKTNKKGRRVKDPNNESINDNLNKDGSFDNPQGALDQAGTTFDPNDPYWKDLYNKTYQNTYDLATTNIDRDQARDLEEAKQEAANRGLPYDPGNAESAYGKAVGGVTDRYDAMKRTASQQAYSAAQGVYGTQGQLANQGFDANMQAILGMSAADLQKYGIDKDDLTKRYAISKQGSGGKSGGGQPAGGFEIIS